MIFCFLVWFFGRDQDLAKSKQGRLSQPVTVLSNVTPLFVSLYQFSFAGDLWKQKRKKGSVKSKLKLPLSPPFLCLNDWDLRIVSRWKQPKTAKLLFYSIREVEEDIADCYIICIAQIIRLLLKFMVVIFVFVQLYKGYVDDARNTDNAWLETHVINYHDDDLFRNVELRVGQSCIFLSLTMFNWTIVLVLK